MGKFIEVTTGKDRKRLINADYIEEVMDEPNKVIGNTAIRLAFTEAWAWIHANETYEQIREMLEQ